MIAVCVMEPKPFVIVRWPTPQNAGLVTYTDDAGNCYQYKAQEVSCKEGAKKIPIQTNIMDINR